MDVSGLGDIFALAIRVKEALEVLADVCLHTGAMHDGRTRLRLGDNLCRDVDALRFRNDALQRRASVVARLAALGDLSFGGLQPSRQAGDRVRRLTHQLLGVVGHRSSIQPRRTEQATFAMVEPKVACLSGAA